MNNFWKAVIVLSAFIAAAQCLTCRRCPLGVFGTCLFGSNVTCSSAQRCFSGSAQFNATARLTLDVRGCVDSDLCGKTVTGTILGAGYTSNFRCCNTDVCNGSTSVKMSLTAALFTALLSSLWGLGA